MSFGASVGDIIRIISFAKQLVRNCRQAGGEYVEVSREVHALHSVLSHLKAEIENPESIPNHRKSKSFRELHPIIGNCDATLKQLDGLLQKYCNINGEPGMARLRVRMRLGGTEMDELAEIRIKLLNHKTTITGIMDAVQLRESGRSATQMNEHGDHLETHDAQLQSILDKVDGIAARMGQQTGSGMTAYEDDNKEVWKQFRRELIQEGCSSELLLKHKDVLRRYIENMDQRGQLDEMPPDSATTTSSGVDPRLWPKDVLTQQDAPPSFNALHDRSEDPSMKEKLWREEDTKFLRSMKSERAKGLMVNQDRGLGFHNVGQYHRSHRDDKLSHPSPPRPITHLTPETRGSENPRINEGSRANDETISSSSSAPKNIAPPTMSTADLILPSAPEHQLSLSNLPISMRSQVSFADNDRRATAPLKPQNLAPSSPAPGTFPLGRPIETPGSTLRNAIHLAPDAQGNEIPVNAQWTRIKRSLISTEVLDQDGMRYEARPDFVAVLGLLSREKIAELAERSHVVREARRARRPNEMPPRPPQPSRPSSHYKPSSGWHGQDTSSDEDGNEFSSSSDENVRHSRPRRREGRRESGRTEAVPIQRPMSQQYPPIQPHVQSGWLNPNPPGYPHQQHPNSWSPGIQSHSPNSQQMQYMPANMEGRHHRHSSSAQGNKRRREPKRGWRDNLAAVGIGGAAASFISVLSDTVADLDI